MGRTYVDVEKLIDMIRQCGYLSLGNLEKLQAEEIAKNLPLSELRQALEEKDEVVAVQVWTKEDILAAARCEGMESLDDDVMEAVMDDARPQLQDCSDGFEILNASVRKYGRKM